MPGMLGTDPYAEAIHRNLNRFARMVADGQFGLLQREPLTTTCNLAAIYHAPHGAFPLTSRRGELADWRRPPFGFR